MFLEHFFVGFHSLLDIKLFSLEDCKSHCIQVVPHLLLMHSQVNTHTLNHVEKVLDATIDICLGRVCGSSENVGDFGLFIILNKVPNSLVGSQWSDKLAFLIFLLS